MSWCLQCGSSGTPERAVGWDEDGEPACGMHRLKAERPLNLAADEVNYKQAAEGPAPMTRYGVTKAVSSAADQQPAAAPSPVQTSAAKESTMRGPQPKIPCPKCSRIIASHQMPNHERTCGVVKERKMKASAPERKTEAPKLISNISVPQFFHELDCVMSEETLNKVLAVLLPSLGGKRKLELLRSILSPAHE